MIVFINGQFVPEDQALVSVYDRGFLYGDGLFEVVFVHSGCPFRWEQHIERLRRGAEFIRMPLRFSSQELLAVARELIARNRMPETLLRLTLTRGLGVRGYSPKGANSPTLVMTLHPGPAFDPQEMPRWRLVTSSLRLPAGEPLAQFKTCNKLAQILARAEAEAAGVDEGVLTNTDGFIVEGASSNLFWLDGSAVCTSPLSSGILAGVTRAVTFELCESLGLETGEVGITPRQLLQCDGVFLSLSSLGIVEGISLDGHTLQRDPITQRLREAYLKLVNEETSAGV